MAEQFISEHIQPIAKSFDTKFMSVGVPGLPIEFIWHRKKYKVTEVLRTWRTTGPCHNGSGEQYTRRHWFEIKTDSSEIFKIYFDKGTHGKRSEMGWFLFSKEV